MSTIWLCGCEWFLTGDRVLHIWPSTPPHPLGCQEWDCQWVNHEDLQDTLNTFSRAEIEVKSHSRWDLWRLKWETWKYRRTHSG